MSCGPPSATETETETIPLAQTLTSAHVRMYVYIWYYGNHVISFHCNAIEFFALRCAGINMITIHRHSQRECASEMQFLINLSSLFAVVATAAAIAVLC